MKPGRWLLLAIAVCAGCDTMNAPREPLPLTPPADVARAPVARVPLEPSAVPPIALAPTRPVSPQSPTPPILVPAKTLYVCVNDSDGQRKQTAIDFAPKVGDICRRHPEMGPCQYERISAGAAAVACSPPMARR